jgi:hypothetical protein
MKGGKIGREMTYENTREQLNDEEDFLIFSKA